MINLEKGKSTPRKYKVLHLGNLIAETNDSASAIAFATTSSCQNEMYILERGEDGKYHPFKY